MQYWLTDDSTDVTDFVSVISQTPCVSMETRRTLAKTFKIWEQIVHQHGYILMLADPDRITVVHFSRIGLFLFLIENENLHVAKKLHWIVWYDTKPNRPWIVPVPLYLGT